MRSNIASRRWTSENSRDSVVALFTNLQSLNGVQVLLTFQTSGSWWIYLYLKYHNIIYYMVPSRSFLKKKSRDITFFSSYTHSQRKHSLVFTGFVCCIIITCQRRIVRILVTTVSHRRRALQPPWTSPKTNMVVTY